MNDGDFTMPAASMSGFTAELRRHGFAVGAADAVTALSVLSYADESARPVPPRHILRLLFASQRSEWEKFDELFNAYWHGRKKSIFTSAPQPQPYSAITQQLWNLPPAEAESTDDAAASAEKAADNESSDAGTDADDTNTAQLRQQAAQRGGKRRDTLPTLHGSEWQALGEALWCALSRRRSRRTVAARHGHRVDLRRTLHRSIRTGGEPLQLWRRRRRHKAARVSVLLDISASMQAHSGFFLLLLKGLLRGAQAEGFVFHTHLVRVTSSLRGGASAPALEKFALQMQGSGGGTRIAHSVRAFCDDYGRHCLGGRSAILIISDGYDSEAPEALQQAMRQLRHRTPRIYWLSPSLSPAHTENPPPQALAAARAFITALAPARSPADIQQAAAYWGKELNR